MARPKKVTFENDLLRIDAQIERAEKSLTELLNARKQLLREKEQYQVKQVSELLRKSGKSFDELLLFLQNDKKNDDNDDNSMAV